MQITANLQPRVQYQMKVAGDSHGGFYEKLQGDGVELSLSNEPTCTNLGGLLIQGEGTYQATGQFQGLKTELKVVPEDQIAEVGGLHVQTGTIYHVDGKVGDQPVRGDIREESKIENVGGFSIESDSWKVFDGQNLHLEVHSEGDGHRITGQDQGKNVDVTAIGLNGGEEFILSGQARPETLAEIASLRPFLSV